MSSGTSDRPPPRPTGLEPGDRGWRDLEVADVDGAGVERRDGRALEGAGGTREWSRLVVTTDSLAQGGRVGRREADDELGGDLDVDDPRDAPGPNSVRWPRLSQMTLSWTTAPASIVLNG